jgi:ketosteroid isomerase-like protein
MHGIRVLGLLCALAWAASGQPADKKQAVLAADAAYRAAVLRSDTAALAAIFADDGVIVHSDGTTDNRANFLDAISSVRLKLQSHERSNVAIQIHGWTAVLLSQTRKDFTYKGNPATDNDESLAIYAKKVRARA